MNVVHFIHLTSSYVFSTNVTVMVRRVLFTKALNVAKEKDSGKAKFTIKYDLTASNGIYSNRVK